VSASPVPERNEPSKTLEELQKKSSDDQGKAGEKSNVLDGKLIEVAEVVNHFAMFYPIVSCYIYRKLRNSSIQMSKNNWPSVENLQN
jgi:hypothetical protein